MRKMLTLAGFLSGLMLLSSCQSTPEGDLDVILSNMRKAIDPDGLSSKITTQVITSKIDSTKIKDGKMVVEIKYPDKLRIRAESKDGILMKGCDGKQGWEFSTKGGLREIKGKELDNLKFQIVFLSPKEKVKDVFESVKLDGEEVVNRKPCYKLVCTPKPMYSMAPLNIYVDKKTSFVIKTEETHIGPEDQTVEVTRYFMDYEKTDGMYFPMKIMSEAGGKIAELTLESIDWDEDLSDTAFDIPDEIK